MKWARLCLVLLWLAYPAFAGETSLDPLDPFPPAIDNALPVPESPYNMDGRNVPELYGGSDQMTPWCFDPPYPIWRI